MKTYTQRQRLLSQTRDAKVSRTHVVKCPPPIRNESRKRRDRDEGKELEREWKRRLHEGKTRCREGGVEGKHYTRSCVPLYLLKPRQEDKKDFV